MINFILVTFTVPMGPVVITKSMLRESSLQIKMLILLIYFKTKVLIIIIKVVFRKVTMAIRIMSS